MKTTPQNEAMSESTLSLRADPFSRAWPATRMALVRSWPIFTRVYRIAFWTFAAAFAGLVILRASMDAAFVPAVKDSLADNEFLALLLAGYLGDISRLIVRALASLPMFPAVVAGGLVASFVVYGVVQAARVALTPEGK